MIQEISQLDIPDRQLMAPAQPSVWTEIGEAEITHTIFGKAKVRIIRKQDQARRRARLLTVLAVAAMAIAGALVWNASQQSEPLQSAAPLPPASAKVQESAPAIQTENIAPAPPPSVTNESVAPPQIAINKPATSQKSVAQQSPDLKGDEQKAAKQVTIHQKPIAVQPKPATPQPLAASQPQTASLAADNKASKNQTDTQPAGKPSPPKQPVAPAVAAPAVTQPAAQSAAGSPADIAPLASPIVKEDTTTQSPAGDKQPADPVNAQGK